MLWPQPKPFRNMAWEIPRNQSLEEATRIAVRAAQDGGWTLTHKRSA